MAGYMGVYQEIGFVQLRLECVNIRGKSVN